MGSIIFKFAKVVKRKGKKKERDRKKESKERYTYLRKPQA